MVSGLKKKHTHTKIMSEVVCNCLKFGKQAGASLRPLFQNSPPKAEAGLRPEADCLHLHSSPEVLCFSQVMQISLSTS